MNRIQLTAILDEEGKIGTVTFDTDTVEIVHDNNTENWFSIFTKHSELVVIKDGKTKDFFFNYISKNPKFIKAFTRFGTIENEKASINTPWKDGNRYLLYYHESLPIVEGVFIEDEPVSYIYASAISRRIEA